MADNDIAQRNADASGLRAATQIDLRRHARIGFPARAVVHELDSDSVPGPAQPVETVDISRSGLGFRAKRMYYVGTIILIILDLPGDRRIMCARVRFSRYVENGQYHAGVEFAVMPSSERLAAWIKRYHETHDPPSS